MGGLEIHDISIFLIGKPMISNGFGVHTFWYYFMCFWICFDWYKFGIWHRRQPQKIRQKPRKMGFHCDMLHGRYRLTGKYPKKDMGCRKHEALKAANQNWSYKRWGPPNLPANVQDVEQTRRELHDKVQAPCQRVKIKDPGDHRLECHGMSIFRTKHPMNGVANVNP